MKIYLIFSILQLCWLSTQCCYFETAKDRQVCDNTVALSVEGKEDWKSVLIYNSKKRVPLPANSFKRTPNIQTLSVATLSSIEPGAFNGLDKLDRLVIWNSDIEEIGPGILDNLPIRSLQIINVLSKISPGFFEKLPELREVDIRNNSFPELKPGVFDNTQTYKLYLDFNKINTIEEGTFANMEYMITLSLSGNNLNTFDSNLLGENNSLQQLWLNRNHLKTITKDMFKHLKDLKKLYIEINEIETIEDGAFYNNVDLDFLDLSNNKLKEIHSKIFPKNGMPQLFYFFIHNNQLTYINNAIFIKSPKLTYISYGGNPFQCPCLDDINDWILSRNITRLCDNVYFSGERPVCIFSELERKKCIYDLELTENLFDAYNEAIKEYPPISLKCDTTKGVKNAVLNDSA